MKHQHLLHSIATTISDYRQGEILAPNAEHVDRWVRQFDPAAQERLLAEMDHVLKESYLSREYFLMFLRGLAGRKQLIGGNTFWGKLRAALATLIHLSGRGPATDNASAAYWRNVRFLEIQRHGGSQREMVHLLKQVLCESYGLDLSSNQCASGPFLYLDDILFTGTRLIIDLHQWIETEAPRCAEVVVVVIGYYRRGFWYAHKAILRAAAAAGKVIRLHWLRSVEFEDRHWAASTRDGFHPTLLPEDPLVRAYAQELAEAGSLPRLRVPGTRGPSRLFSSEEGRHLLEQQLLLAGLKIRSFYRNPQAVMRPLGYHWLKDLGFGATVATYRNCPNNCPLAWWWDTASVPASRSRGQWYPLLPRKV